MTTMTLSWLDWQLVLRFLSDDDSPGQRHSKGPKDDGIKRFPTFLWEGEGPTDLTQGVGREDSGGVVGVRVMSASLH